MDTKRPMCCDAGRAECGVLTLAKLARLAAMGAVVTIVGVAGGCSYSNDRNDLGGGYAGLEPGVVLNGLAPSAAALASASGAAEPNPDAIAADPNRPALDLGRSGWEPKIFLVPVVGIASGPTYSERFVVIDAAARDRGQYPSPATALELSPNDYWAVAGEAWAAAPMAVYEALLMPYRAIKAAGPDWRQPEQRGPAEAFSRAPAWTARGVPSGTTRADELPAATPGDGVAAGHVPNPLD